MFDDAPPPPADESSEPRAPSAPSSPVDVLGTLAGGLGHDLRNIVMPVLLRLDVLSTSATLSERDRSDLASIRKSMSHLQQLAEGLRLLGADATRRGSDAQITRLADWWHDLRAVAMNALPAKVQLVGDLSTELPVAAIPPGVLAQVVISILIEVGHALGPIAQPRVTLSAHVTSRVVRLVIGHNGTSMDTEALRRCFEPYAAAHARESASGLGLAAGRAMMLSLGGELTAHSGGWSSAGAEETARRDTHGDTHEDTPGAIYRDNVSYALDIPLAATSPVETRRVRLCVNNPRAVAVARMALSQLGLEAVSSDDLRPVRAILCDVETLPFVLAGRSSTDPSSDEMQPRLIVLGHEDERVGDRGAKWITPYDADALARALA